MKRCPKCGTDYPDTVTLCPADGVALAKEDDSLVGKILAEKYRIDEKLSEGGMGAVYRGTHVLMDKTVAIKVLRPALAADEKIVARFSREARAASRISHPHALSVTDFGEAEDGVVFLVMEYLSGKTLKEVIREEGPLPLSRVAEIMKQVGGALDAAHEQGVVHRDLKSDNIMLLSTSGTDYAKVLDFGIAKIKENEGEYDPSITAPDLVIGTPQYMSPEQCSQSNVIDARSDVYSLGVILFEMLVGHVPFTGNSPTSIMLKHLQEPAPSVLDERSDLPVSLGPIVNRALAKLPENRYQTADELIQDLSAAAGLVSGAIPAVQHETAQTKSATASQENEPDEVTVVRPKIVTVPSPVSPRAPQTTPMPYVSAFNPWKILIPSMAGLIVVFAVIYAFTRTPEGTKGSSSEPALVADPNSKPVEPAQSPTGKGEAGIPAGGITTNQSINANTNANADPNVNANFLPDNVNTNTNANANANAAASIQPNANVNSNTNRPSATPPLPSPTRQVNANTATEAPTPAKLPTPRPTLPPPTVQPELPRED